MSLEELVSSVPSGTFLRECFGVMRKKKQLASAVLQAGKTAEKDIGMKAIDVGKTVAIDAGKKQVENAAKRLTTPKPQVALLQFHPKKLLKSKRSYSQIRRYKCN